MRRFLSFLNWPVVFGTTAVVLIALALHIGFVYLALMTAPALSDGFTCKTSNQIIHEILLCTRSWRLWIEFYLWIPGATAIAASIECGGIVFRDWAVVQNFFRQLLSRFGIDNESQDSEEGPGDGNESLLYPIYWRRIRIIFGLVIGVLVSFFMMWRLHSYLLSAPDQTILAPHTWEFYNLVRFGLPGIPLLLLLFILMWEWRRVDRYGLAVRHLWYQFGIRKLVPQYTGADYVLHTATSVPHLGQESISKFLLAFRPASIPDTAQIVETYWDRDHDRLTIEQNPILSALVKTEPIRKIAVIDQYYILLGANTLYGVPRLPLSNAQSFEIPAHNLSLFCVLKDTGEIIFYGPGGLRGAHIERLKESPVQGFRPIINGKDGRKIQSYLSMINCKYTGNFLSVVQETSGQVVLQCQAWEDLDAQWRLSAELYENSDATRWGRFGKVFDMTTIPISKGVVDVAILHYREERYWLTGFTNEKPGQISFNFDIRLSGSLATLCVDSEENLWIWGIESGSITAYRIPHHWLRWKRWLYRMFGHLSISD